MKDLVSTPFGRIKVFLHDLITGEMELVEEKNNLVVFGGADILARLLAGDASYKADTIYFEFDNVDPTPPASYLTDRTANRAYYDFAAGTRDYLRMPLSGVPALVPSTGDYVANTATFFAMTSGAGQVGGAGQANYTNGTSQVIGVGLLASPVQGVPANDVLFARTYFTTPITKDANKQVAISWDMTMI